MIIFSVKKKNEEKKRKSNLTKGCRRTNVLQCFSEDFIKANSDELLYTFSHCFKNNFEGFEKETWGESEKEKEKWRKLNFIHFSSNVWSEFGNESVEASTCKVVE